MEKPATSPPERVAPGHPLAPAHSSYTRRAGCPLPPPPPPPMMGQTKHFGDGKAARGDTNPLARKRWKVSLCMGRVLHELFLPARSVTIDDQYCYGGLDLGRP